MIRRVLALLALALPLAAPAAPPVHLPTHRVARAPFADWTKTVTLTPEGGIRIGNPDSKVKLVEFSSFTCPHCAAFATTGFTPLAERYVRGGQVSFELRSALRDALDVTMALATRCVAPPRYFAGVEAVMGSQQDWYPKAVDYIGAHRDALNGTDKTAAVHAMLAAIGVEPLLAKEGVTPAALDRCLVDKTAEAAIQKTSEDAWNVRKISGTPAFVIDGTAKPDAHDWATLEPLVQAAIKG